MATGGTECTPEMKALKNIDVAFVPMGATGPEKAQWQGASSVTVAARKNGAAAPSVTVMGAPGQAWPCAEVAAASFYRDRDRAATYRPTPRPATAPDECLTEWSVSMLAATPTWCAGVVRTPSIRRIGSANDSSRRDHREGTTRAAGHLREGQSWPERPDIDR